MNPGGNGGPGGQDSSAKISANFINIYPLKKPNSSSVWHGPPSSCLPFEHSSTKMGSLDIDPVYSTLCPRITSTRSTSKFHFNMFQYSVGGAVMPDAITFGQDCRLTSFPSMIMHAHVLPDRRLPSICRVKAVRGCRRIHTWSRG